MGPLLQKLIATTEEIDYSEMLEWFGLQFARGGAAREWMLEIGADATPAQKAHLASLLAHSRS